MYKRAADNKINDINSQFSSTMVVLKPTLPLSSLHTNLLLFFNLSSKHTSSSLLFLSHAHPTRPAGPSRLSIRSYMEKPDSISGFANKIIGSLPVVGLIARILSDEGGVGGDIIDFAEFRRRVGKKCAITDSRAFYEFQDRRGRVKSYKISPENPFPTLVFVFLFLIL